LARYIEMVLWGDALPTIRIRRATVSAEVRMQARIQASIEPEESRP
jgi:hypothetical protein